MFDAGAIVGKLKLDKEAWDSAIGKVKADQKGLEGTILRNSDQIKKMGLAFTAVGGAIVGSIGLLVNAAAKEEVVFAKLRTAVENIGVSYDNVEGEIKAFAGRMQEATVYGDDQTAMIITQLLPYTKDLTKAYEGSTIAMDLAASGLFDLTTAAKYVGMAMSGNVEMLGRYIPELRVATNEQLANMTTAEKTAYALGLLKDKFGGMAAAELNTFSGRLKQLKNYTGDLAEAIGKTLLPILTDLVIKVKNIIKPIIAWVEENQKLVGTIMIIAGALGGMALAIGPLLMLLPGITAAAIGLGIGLGPLTLIIAGIAAVIALVIVAITNWATITTFLEKTWWTCLAGIQSAIRFLLEAVQKAVDFAGKLPGKIGGVFRNLSVEISGAIEGIEASIDRAKEKTVEAADKVEKKVKQTTQSIASNVEEMVDDMAQNTASAMDELTDRMKGAISDGSEYGTEQWGAYGSQVISMEEGVARGVKNINDGMQANWMDTCSAMSATAVELTGSLSSIFGTFSELQKVNIQNDRDEAINAENLKYETAVDRINKTITDEGAKTAALTELEANHQVALDKIREDAEKKEAEVRKRLKPFMIAQALANTAQGATKAFAQWGWPLGYIMAALTIAAGMAQVAIIKAQKFQYGGFKPKGIWGIAGEAGPEVVASPTLLPPWMEAQITPVGAALGGGQIIVRANFYGDIRSEADLEELATSLGRKIKTAIRGD